MRGAGAAPGVVGAPSTASPAASSTLTTGTTARRSSTSGQAQAQGSKRWHRWQRSQLRLAWATPRGGGSCQQPTLGGSHELLSRMPLAGAMAWDGGAAAGAAVVAAAAPLVAGAPSAGSQPQCRACLPGQTLLANPAARLSPRRSARSPRAALLWCTPGCRWPARRAPRALLNPVLMHTPA